MDAQKLAIPLLAFAGGAILGRVLGLKTLVRGAMTAAAVTGMTAQPAIARADGHARRVSHTRRRKPARRSAHKKAAAT
jgi:hypothetical protein